MNLQKVVTIFNIVAQEFFFVKKIVEVQLDIVFFGGKSIAC